jgi:siroheme synthase (precorrin-2 oxidase/ferrochelatase)
VSSGGASPALASHLRDGIETWLAEIGAAGAAVTLAAQRSELQAAGTSTESIDWSDRVRDALHERP